MTEFLEAQNPLNFGKDSFCPFIGQVEDVNDPVQTNRVKVRIVGVHPFNRKNTSGNDDNLSTDDLPWAKCLMPVTHSQQARMGGKHGLLPGCWVIGFFLDGEDCQQPIIIGSYNFTSNSVDRDNRQDGAGEDGKLPDSTEGLTKLNVSSNTRNTTRIRPDETAGNGPGYSNKADVAGDGVNSAADSKCFGKQASISVAEDAAINQVCKIDENPTGQKYNVTTGDGQCGSNAHSAEDVRLKMEERLPSQVNRFVYNDLVWQRFSGNFIDLNGILAQLALELCSLLKQNVLSMKSEREEQTYRQTLPTSITSVPDRDGVRRQEIADQQERVSDVFHATMGAFIDNLCGLIMNLLQQQNNGGSGGQGDNNLGGNIGADPNTLIEDPGARCVTDTFMNNFNAMVVNALDEAETESERIVSQAASTDGLQGSSIDAVLGLATSFASLSAADLSGMIFPLVDKYADRTDVHNSQGDASQDKTSKEGCKPVRQYNTEEGYLSAAGAIAAMLASGRGFGGGGGSGGGNGGSIAKPQKSDWAQGNFGGLKDPTTGEIDFTTCEDGATIKVPDDNVFDTKIPPGEDGPAPSRPDFQPGVNTYPNGYNAVITNVSLPSSEEACARNFIDGTPNVSVITAPGQGYYYHNIIEPENAFPEIFIPGYNGVPVPVVNEDSGELVAILTSCGLWDPNYPLAPATVIPSNSSNGILSNDPRFDIVLGGFYIQNTGFNYCEPEIAVWDSDKGTYTNADVKAVVSEGRIVDIQIINSGTGYLRIPVVQITETNPDCRGYGAIVYPIMNVVPRAQSKDTLDPPPVTQSIFCPAKNQQNRFTQVRDVNQMTSNIIQSALPGY